MTERDAIALTLYGEARGESAVGRIAVACVLQNRLKAGRWGHTYAAVALAPKQFSCWNQNDPNAAMLQQIAAGAGVNDQVLRECYWIADGLLSDVVTPLVARATHYYAISMEQPPRWAASGEYIGTVGKHRFYEDVR